MTQPVLFCYDGSEGSKAAMIAAAELIARPTAAVVLTVWQPAVLVLARAGAFGSSFIPNEAEVEEIEEREARAAAEEGQAGAIERGYDAEARVAQAEESVAKTILTVASEIDARLIVCGTRGRGALSSTLLGSVSHEVLNHARRPVLIAPQA